MRHTVASILIFLVCSTNAIACEYGAGAICELMREVELGSVGPALEKVEALAKNGDLQAQMALGAIYGLGKGVKQDDAKAFAWLLQAARADSSEAQAMVGNFYAAGRAGPIDLVEAKKWYEIAANAGEIEAQRMLGTLYARGEGAPLDYPAAYLWFALAALSGDSDAQKYKDMVRPYLSEKEFTEVTERVKAWKPNRTK